MRRKRPPRDGGGVGGRRAMAGLYRSSPPQQYWPQQYCVLAEVALVGDPDKKAWGTFITRLDPQRELAIQIPHPLNDSNTPEQGASVFKTTGARSFLPTARPTAA